MRIASAIVILVGLLSGASAVTFIPASSHVPRFTIGFVCGAATFLVASWVGGERRR